MRRLANSINYIIAAIVTIVTFIGYLESDGLKNWVKANSGWLFFALIVCFLIAALSLNDISDEKKRNRELRAAAAQSSAHDRKLFAALIAALPSDGSVIEWLKENFVANLFPDDEFKVIQSVLRSMRLRSLEFDDPELEENYDQLHRSLQRFEDAALQYMWLEPNAKFFRIPEEWENERFDKAIDATSAARLEVVEKYNSFLELAHNKGIDQ